MSVRVRATAPVRLDFAGAWTDVAPFVERHGGVVVNAAIDLRASVEVERGGSSYRFDAVDLAIQETHASRGALHGDGPLALVRSAVHDAGIGPCHVRTRSDAPPGSGLGSSGAMGVALVGALDRMTGGGRDAIACAEAAWRAETIGAAIAGGRQDQYAAALGGFNVLHCHGDIVEARPIAVDPAFADELARHVVLCYTGTTRFSSTTITRVMRAFTDGDPAVTSALHELVAIGEAMASALADGDIVQVGALLAANWRAQQRLDPAMCTERMAVLEAAMREAGSLGGKAAGSGAGGSMFFVVPDPQLAIRHASALGVEVIPVRWAMSGLSVSDDE